MFFANSGRMGLGPLNMQLLQGARTPFVLRKWFPAPVTR